MSMDIEYELLHKLDTLGTHDHDELLSQFQSIVGKNLSPSSCSFYLEMGNWNLQRAICAYYDVNSSIHLPSFVVVAESMHTDTLSVRPNEIFNKCWKLRNTGNTAWPHNLKLKHMRGHLFTGAQHCGLPSVEPGETTDISVTLEAPAYDGAYTATWRLMTLQGTLCGGILLIVSCATTYWREYAFSREGLWQSCPLDSCGDFEFVNNDGLDSDINIVRAFMLLGILLIFIATLVQFLGGCCCERSCNLPVYTLNILSLICLITAMAYYATHFDNGLWEFAWSYYLGWAGTGVYGLGVALTKNGK